VLSGIGRWFEQSRCIIHTTSALNDRHLTRAQIGGGASHVADDDEQFDELSVGIGLAGLDRKTTWRFMLALCVMSYRYVSPESVAVDPLRHARNDKPIRSACRRL